MDAYCRGAGAGTYRSVDHVWIYQYAYPSDWRNPFFFVVGAILVWECNRAGIILSRRRYTELAQTRQRVIFQIEWLILFCSLIRITQTFFYQVIGLWHPTGHFEFQPYFFNTLVSVVATIQVAAVLEGIYLYRSWPVSYTETQELKKISLQSQLESLKTQLNPHFLFSNLNSLSALIGSDASKAERFVDELSSVYRYFLHQNNRMLCPLADELAFLNAYFHLIRTRYGEGIFLELDINSRYTACLVPPLTLQIVFDNAIKHNVISASYPLMIKIYVQAGMPNIENNLQPKK